MQDALRFILIAISASVIGYIGWTLYGEVTETSAARMSDSVHLAQAQAESMHSSLSQIGAIGEEERSEFFPPTGGSNSERPANS